MKVQMQRYVKPLVKKLTPPLCFDIYKQLFQSPAYSGPYPSFEEAKKNSSGYDSAAIFEKVKMSTHQMLENTYAFAQDGISSIVPTYRYPVIAALLQQAAKYGELRVLDFGGALGTSYLALKRFLDNAALNIQWGIVEQPHYVTYGKENLATESLFFFDSIFEALESIRPSVCLLSSSLQYLPNPEKLLATIFAQRLDCVIIDRIPTQGSTENLIGVEQVPKQIYDASYPVWLFAYSQILNLCQQHYRFILPIDCTEYPLSFHKHLIEYKGLILRNCI